ncbi:hypothetical protein [Sorangium sp. So ce362]|uniref:hypothetical protein n=1 Tax=Sorangium sp. So ce362 TaxID=3133303 RepID=UPI003F63FF3C
MTTKEKRSKPTRKPSSGRPAGSPSSREVADTLDMALSPPLKPEQAARLRKALPGYAGILDDAALLAEDAGARNLPNVTLAAQAEQKYLAVREAVAHAVYQSLTKPATEGGESRSSGAVSTRRGCREQAVCADGERAGATPPSGAVGHRTRILDASPTWNGQ